MALRLRRGTNAERQLVTPAEGELVYTTDTKLIYAGDGSTIGGNLIAGLGSILADPTPKLGASLDLNGNDITGTGNINIAGNVTASGNINIGDAGSDVLTVTAGITGNLVPTNNITSDIGSSTKRWKEAWIDQLNIQNQITAGRINADIIGDDSTVVFNSATSKIAASSLQGTANININGVLDGDMKGSVFADNSTLLVDGTNATITGSAVKGSVTNLTELSSKLVVAEAVATGDAPLRCFGSYDGTDGHFLTLTRSRGTVASKVALNAGDHIASIVFSDLQKNASAAQIRAHVDPYGTPGATIAPGKLSFYTSSNAGTPSERAFFDYTGQFVTYGIHNGRTSAATGIPFYSLSNTNTVSDGARLLMRRSRGTYASPTAVVSGDVLHRLTWGGHDGTQYKDTAFITARVDGTVATNQIPTSLDVKTTSASGAVQTNASFRKDLVTEVGGAIKLAVYADNTARDTAISSPEAGMIVFNTTNTKFQGYTGAAWVDLN